ALQNAEDAEPQDDQHADDDQNPDPSCHYRLLLVHGQTAATPVRFRDTLRSVRRGAPVRVLVLLLCGTAALAACFAGSGRSAGTGTGWPRTNLDAVSQPAPVGGKFALYARQSDSLQVLALNASDGTTAWVAPASPGDVTPGVPVELAVRAGTVFYLE